MSEESVSLDLCRSGLSPPGGCVACAEVYGRCFAGELEPPMYVSARRRRSASACLYKPPTKNIALKIFWVLWDLCGLSGVL